MVDEHAQVPESPEPDEPTTSGEPAEPAESAEPVPGGSEPGEPGQRGSEPGDLGQRGSEPGEPGPSPTQVLLRRAPRYRAFVLTGVLVGVIAAAVVVFSGILPLHESDSPGTVFLYFVLAFSLFGALLGAGTAILVERRH